MSNSNSINRRHFLGLATAFTGTSLLNNPYSLLFDQIVNGFVNRAYAETTGINPRRYIYIQQYGAPSRWTFDLFLTPYTSTGFQSNPMVGTKYIESGGRYTDLTYSTVKYNGINLPHMWQFPVPRAGGGNRPMTDLIDHILSMQGVNTGNAGHPGSQSLHMKPTGSVRSLPALASDYTENPIPAINLSTPEYKFDSLNTKSFVTVPVGGNMLQTLLDPFIASAPADFLSKLGNVEQAVDRGVAVIDALAATEHPLAQSLNKDRAGAEELLRTGFPGLAEKWNGLLAKYRDLIRRAIDPTQRLQGINDKPIGKTSTRDREYSLNSTTNIVTTPDIRDLITGSTEISNMAEHFAVTEFVVLNDLSRSISLNTGPLIKLNTNGNTQSTFNFDQHDSGRMISLYLNTMYFRAFSSCLLELIDKLKEADLFSETIIDVASEFNRSPKSNGFGADHGWQGSSTTIYSGTFSGALFLGNIKAHASTSYMGTWGIGAGVKELANQQLGLNHVAATIASLLRTPSPVTSAKTLVQVSGGKLVPLIEKTKIV